MNQLEPWIAVVSAFGAWDANLMAACGSNDSAGCDVRGAAGSETTGQSEQT